MRRIIFPAFILSMALPLMAADVTEPSKQAEVLLKHAPEEGQTFSAPESRKYMTEFVSYGNLFVIYKTDAGVGAVIAPKKKKETARVEGKSFTGVFYLSLRDRRVNKAVAVENARVSRVPDVGETHCVQAARQVSEEAAKELEKYFRSKHQLYSKDYFLPQDKEFRGFIIVEGEE